MNPDNWTENQAILYLYDAQMLRCVRPGGMLSTSAPSPLTRAQIEPVLRKLAEHRSYAGQTIVCHDENFNPVVLEAGRIKEVAA